MVSDKLQVRSMRRLRNATMLLAFSGWMDGGDVSTGTVGHLVSHLRAEAIAEIDPHGFYIDNFPGDMTVTSMFRPHVKIVDGLMVEFSLPANTFYCAKPSNLILFRGKEPNLNWHDFGNCIFTMAERVDVKRIIFIGSFAGEVPHTREPRLHVTVSDARLKREVARYGVKPTDYEGPASFATYLMAQAPRLGFEMMSLVAEIPAYVQGMNPMSIEAVARRLAAILGLRVNLDALRAQSNEWESRVTAQAEQDDELAEQIRELETRYDTDLLDATPGGE